MLSGLLRDLPVEDLESMFEFLSVLSLPTMDEGSRLLLLECLQTFVPWQNAAAGDDFTRIPSTVARMVIPEKHAGAGEASAQPHGTELLSSAP